jgi:hypothetical protein
MTFIKGIASIATAMVVGLSAPSAWAGYLIQLTQDGSNVDLTGSGAIDLSGLSFDGSGGAPTEINPSTPYIAVGAGCSFPVTCIDYYGAATGPGSFGSGATFIAANSSSGDTVTYGTGGDEVGVPTGYVSGGFLSGSAIYDNQTFSSLGVTPGRYVWTWGPAGSQSITLDVGVVPEPSTWTRMLLGFAGLSFAGYQSAGRRRTACNV